MHFMFYICSCVCMDIWYSSWWHKYFNGAAIFNLGTLTEKTVCAAAAHCHRAFLSFLATRPSSFYNANIKNICSKWEIFHLSTSSLLLSDLLINAVCKNGSLLSVQGMRIFTGNIFAIKFPPLEFVVNLLMEFRFLASQNLITSIPKAERYDMSRKKNITMKCN